MLENIDSMCMYISLSYILTLMPYLPLEKVYEHLCILQEGKESQVANLCWGSVHYLTIINTMIKCSRVVDRKDSGMRNATLIMWLIMFRFITNTESL